MLRPWILVAVILAAGCGTYQDAAQMAPKSEVATFEDVGGDIAAGFDGGPVMVAQATRTDSDLPQTPSQAAGDIRRKIIYSANVVLYVEKFDDIPGQVQQLTSKHDAYIANSEIKGQAGSRRTGRWIIRVPVAQYGAFLQDIEQLGELQSRSQDSQEVTAEYYDVQARIRNKQKEESRLIELLDSRAGKLEDVLAVEKELSRVREEIERMQGRMRVLENQTSLSTVTLLVEERADYVPPASATFGTRISRVWHGSLDSLLKAGQNTLLFLVGAAPWVVISLLPLLLLGYLVRRRRRAPGAA